MIFTRYLYNADEVVLTFIESLLGCRELNECYFWIAEYYKSGFEVETWNILWKIYYDFYALSYPKLENNHPKMKHNRSNIFECIFFKLSIFP